ncbi:MAG: hypothetical protein Q7R34_02340 [Dehalococcoidia bacterium]|nr:hypothetical protein [Dehalococcoidia bacterium]
MTASSPGSVAAWSAYQTEGCPEDMAQEIADTIAARSHDVRDAIRVARLAPDLGVEKAIRLLLEV